MGGCPGGWNGNPRVVVPGLGLKITLKTERVYPIGENLTSVPLIPVRQESFGGRRDRLSFARVLPYFLGTRPTESGQG